MIIRAQKKERQKCSILNKSTITNKKQKWLGQGPHNDTTSPSFQNMMRHNKIFCFLHYIKAIFSWELDNIVGGLQRNRDRYITVPALLNRLVSFTLPVNSKAFIDVSSNFSAVKLIINSHLQVQNWTGNCSNSTLRRSSDFLDALSSQVNLKDLFNLLLCICPYKIHNLPYIQSHCKFAMTRLCIRNSVGVCQ